jgi:hypothetical protein
MGWRSMASPRERRVPFLGALLTVTAVLLGGCGGGSVGRADVRVYISSGAEQCQSNGMSPQASAQRLINAGVDVLKSDCGVLTGVAFPAVCGGPTGDILVHEIRAANLPDAERLGFQDVATLTAAGRGYALVDCTTRQPLR